MEINTSNDYWVSVGENLPNHTLSKEGFGKYVVAKSIMGPPLFRTKQEAFRFAAWVMLCAEVLPDEPEQMGVTFDDVVDAIKNT